MSRLWSSKEIEQEVSKLSCGWVKRKNLREKLTCENNEYLERCVRLIQENIRALKASGAKQSYLRSYYAAITEMELKKL